MSISRLLHLPSPRREAGLAILGALLSLPVGACDFPTALPKWDATWQIAGEHSRIPVDSLLPSGLRVGPSGTTFELRLATVSFSRSVGETCGPTCAAFNGQTVPKPAFTTTFGGSIPLPLDVRSVDFNGARIDVRLENDLGFDPLRPGPGARGYIVITASSGGRPLARDSIAGETAALPSGGTLTRTLLLGTDSATGPISVEVRLASPAGDPVRLDVGRSIAVVAIPSPPPAVTRATVAVAARTVSAEAVDLRLGDVDEEISDRTKSGALVIDAVNPFDLLLPARIRLTSPTATIEKQVEIGPGTTRVRAELNESEIRSLLGQDPVHMTIRGTLSAPSGSIVVRPGQTVEIETRTELVLGPGD